MINQNKVTEGVTKKVWILNLKRFGEKIYSENKEDLLKLWELLDSGNFHRLKSVSKSYEWEEDKNDKFYYPENFKLEVSSLKIYLHPNKDRAEKSMAAYEKLQKVGIKTKPKKKTS